jgi:choline dehydrogenase
MNERVMYWPRGRVWGGSSALNAMVYIRGHPHDYDRWGREGAKGWAYKLVVCASISGQIYMCRSCLPYFKRAQSHQIASDGDVYRGSKGPLRVQQCKGDHPLHQAWLKAGQEAGKTCFVHILSIYTLIPGYGFTHDVNGYRQEGVSYFDQTIKDGKRWSTAQAYLWPVRKLFKLFINLSCKTACRYYTDRTYSLRVTF